MKKIVTVIIDILSASVFVAQMINAFLMGASDNNTISTAPKIKDFVFSDIQFIVIILTILAATWASFRYVAIMKKYFPNMSKLTVQFTIPFVFSIVIILIVFALFNLARNI